MQSSSASRRRLNGGTLSSQSRRAATKTPPPAAAAKQVMSFEELAAQQPQPPNRKPASSRPALLQRGGPCRSLRAASPLQQRIRQQILHRHGNDTTTTTSDSSGSKKNSAEPININSRETANKGGAPSEHGSIARLKVTTTPKQIVPNGKSKRSAHLESPPSPERPFPGKTSPKKITGTTARSFFSPAAAAPPSSSATGNSAHKIMDKAVASPTASSVKSSSPSPAQPFLVRDSSPAPHRVAASSSTLRSRSPPSREPARKNAEPSTTLQALSPFRSSPSPARRNNSMSRVGKSTSNSTSQKALRSPSPAPNTTSAARRQRYVDQRVQQARKALAGSGTSATASNRRLVIRSPNATSSPSSPVRLRSLQRAPSQSNSINKQPNAVLATERNKTAAQSRVRTPPVASTTSATKTNVLSPTITSSRTKSPAIVRAKSNPGLRVRTARTPLSPRNSSLSKHSETGKDNNTRSDDRDKGPSTRRNLDKKSARLKYGGDFANEIYRYMAGIHSMTSPLAAAITPQNGKKKASSSSSSCVQVYVRKRPIFAAQLESGDFDVVQIVDDCNTATTVTPSSRAASAAAAAAAAAVVVYKTFMAADMRTKLVQPVAFSDGVTAAFDDQTGSEAVYRTAVQPLVHSVLHRGKASTLLMFGQTGSGKTYTMSACLKLVAAELFNHRSVKQIEVQCLELAGRRCRDLMQSDEHAAGEVRIIDNEDGSVTFIDAGKSLIDSPRQLVAALEQCQERRATQSTEQNDVSSRSHAVFQIKIVNGEGSLTLLDCAGTERRNDSLMHSKERQVESTEINASLYALKECIRVRTCNRKAQHKVHIPYRSSNLTRVLRESLENEDATLAVIGCIAPEATATEHTIQTLKTLCNLIGTEWHEGKQEKLLEDTSAEAALPLKKWDNNALKKWLSDRSLLGNSPVSTKLDGKSILRMSKIQLRNALYDNETPKGGRTASALGMEKADKLFHSLREESGRIARLDLQRRLGG